MNLKSWKELAVKGLHGNLESEDELARYNQLIQRTVFWFIIVETILGYFYFAFVLKEWWSLAILVVLLTPLNIAMFQAWQSRRRPPEDSNIVSRLRQANRDQDK